MIIVSPLLIFTRITILQNKHHTHHRQIRKKEYAKRINNKNDRRSKSICLTPEELHLLKN